MHQQRAPAVRCAQQIGEREVHHNTITLSQNSVLISTCCEPPFVIETRKKEQLYLKRGLLRPPRAADRAMCRKLATSVARATAV